MTDPLGGRIRPQSVPASSGHRAEGTHRTCVVCVLEGGAHSVRAGRCSVCGSIQGERLRP